MEPSLGAIHHHDNGEEDQSDDYDCNYHLVPLRPFALILSAHERIQFLRFHSFDDALDSQVVLAVVRVDARRPTSVLLQEHPELCSELPAALRYFRPAWGSGMTSSFCIANRLLF